MRCYICDWSPTGEVSLFHETTELNGFVHSDYSALLGGAGRVPATQYSNNRLIRLDDGKDICAHCNHSAKTAASSWNFSEEAEVSDQEPDPADEYAIAFDAKCRR
jgi:hypothetical protein